MPIKLYTVKSLYIKKVTKVTFLQVSFFFLFITFLYHNSSMLDNVYGYLSILIVRSKYWVNLKFDKRTKLHRGTKLLEGTFARRVNLDEKFVLWSRWKKKLFKIVLNFYITYLIVYFILPSLLLLSLTFLAYFSSFIISKYLFYNFTIIVTPRR